MTESSFVRHGACEACGSSDANAVYNDGHTHCFACDAHGTTEGFVAEAPRKKTAGLLNGEFRPLLKRRISEATCKLFGYTVASVRGDAVQVAPYFNSKREVVAQKLRSAGKTFSVAGKMDDALLFGAHLWSGGKKIVVTEGEIDAMSVSQIQGNKYPVVSIPTGAKGARKAIKKHLEYLDNFEEIIFMFDMDEPGQEAAQECAELFKPGKAKIATLPLKDANECLVAGKEAAVIQAVWNAKAYRPDGLVTVEDLMPELDKPIEQGLPWFLDSLTKITYGRRYGELYGFGAGTGIGKTDVFTQQIEYDIFTLNQPVGLLFLEQQPIETITRVAGKNIGKRLHVPDGSWTQEERAAAVAKLKGKVVLYNSFGQTDWEVIANKIRYMALSDGIRLFYLDHLTAMADTANERESLEQIMKEMAGLANELKIIIHFISHLATPEGKPHEEGGQVSIRHFKGARAIGFWSYFMFGLERNQQAEDITLRSTTVLRVLKDRYTGQATGTLLYLGYDADTGRLFETSKPESASAFRDETSEF